jgi:hypothetical protein
MAGSGESPPLFAAIYCGKLVLKAETKGLSGYGLCPVDRKPQQLPSRRVSPVQNAIQRPRDDLPFGQRGGLPFAIVDT